MTWKQAIIKVRSGFDDDDGLSAPSSSTLDAAIRYLGHLMRHGHRPPLTIVPSPNGEVVIQLDATKTVYIDELKIEIIVFCGDKIASRHDVPGHWHGKPPVIHSPQKEGRA